MNRAAKNAKNLEKQQRILFKMPADQLVKYCATHPGYSLPEGIMNTRFKGALQVMEDCSAFLTPARQDQLADYVESTFNRGQIRVSPEMFDVIYYAVLSGKSSKKAPLQKAIHEFLEFALAPMPEYKKKQLEAFANHVSPSRQKATEFQRGMDRYRQETCLFSH